MLAYCIEQTASGQVAVVAVLEPSGTPSTLATGRTASRPIIGTPRTFVLNAASAAEANQLYTDRSTSTKICKDLKDMHCQDAAIVSHATSSATRVAGSIPASTYQLFIILRDQKALRDESNLGTSWLDWVFCEGTWRYLIEFNKYNIEYP